MVEFKFSKSYGTYKKDDVKQLDKALARSLQDVRKVGKITGDVKSGDQLFKEEAEGKLQKMEDENKAGKAELAKAKKELAASIKMQLVTQNKLDKLIKARATK